VAVLRRFLGEKHPIVGVSDSAFHASLPDEYKFYGIPIKDSRALGLYRCGYHGISVQSVVSQTEKIIGYLPEKVIVCHLGGGASITAVRKGQSLNTTMGFTPLEGLVMATRVGDIDPGAVLYLMEKLGKDKKALGAYFNNDCGLLGLSGKSDDIRKLLVLEQAGNYDAQLALKIYVNKIKQYIGQMAAVLGGLDLLILAGTVGERSFIIRERICAGLEFLGLQLDKKLNNQSEGIEVSLEVVNSPVKILVVKTDEMAEIAKAAYKLVG
jgi:acetate kinase